MSCNERKQKGNLGPGAKHLMHYKNCTKRLYCKDGEEHKFEAGETPDVHKCKCTEWKQEENLGKRATHLMHYRNCTKRLYCTDKTSHDFKVDEFPDVYKCEQKADTSTPSDTTSGITFACPGNDPFVWCSKKIPSASILSGINHTTKDWQSCQRKCWEHGDACQGWAFSKKGACQFGPSRQQTNFKYDTNWIGGPRYDPDSRSAVNVKNTPETSSSDDDAGDSSDTYVSTPEKAWYQDWRILAGIGASIVMVFFFVIVLVMTMK